MNQRLDPHMTGKKKYQEIDLSAYFTPSWCTHVLMKYMMPKPAEKVWEPFVGEGNIAEILKQYDYDVYCSDIKNYGYSKTWIIDFKDKDARWIGEEICNGPPRWIISNPPYRECASFVRKTLKIAKEYTCGVAYLLRNEFDCGKTRADIFQNNPAFNHKIVLTNRPKWFSDNRAAPRHNYAWYIWDYQYPSYEFKRITYDYETEKFTGER